MSNFDRNTRMLENIITASKIFTYFVFFLKANLTIKELLIERKLSFHIFFSNFTQKIWNIRFDRQLNSKNLYNKKIIIMILEVSYTIYLNIDGFPSKFDETHNFHFQYYILFKCSVFN